MESASRRNAVTDYTEKPHVVQKNEAVAQILATVAD
jgi:hypothetical protein